MADLRGEQLKDSYQNVVTRGTGNKLENGNGVEFADLDDKASLSALGDAAFEDYEEGTWTPDLRGLDVGSIERSTYIKVGSSVTIYFDFTNSDTFDSSLSLRIENLPFASLGAFGGSIRMGGEIIFPSILSDPTRMGLRFPSGPVLIEDVDDGTRFQGVINYEV